MSASIQKVMLGLRLPTDPRWVNLVEKNIEEILTDHAYCEQKAASNAISCIVKFPDYPDLVDEMVRLAALRDALETALLAEIDGLLISARDADRLPNTSSLTFPGIDADALLVNMPEVMLGTGSACTSGAVEPSHVLTAIGLSREQASATVRLSAGRYVRELDCSEISHFITAAFSRL